MVIELRPGYVPDRRRFLLWTLLTFVTIGLSMAFLDRHFASFSHDVLHRPRWCVWLTWLPEPLDPLAIAMLLAAFIWRVAGQNFDRIWRTAFAAAFATLLATLAVMALKYGFGRLWPETWVANNPSWIGNHQFSFQPFHGGRGYESFPSGHTARITAPFAVFWHRVPRWRALWALPGLIVAIGLLGANFHFVSDCIAGAWLGVVCAILVLRFI